MCDLRRRSAPSAVARDICSSFRDARAAHALPPGCRAQGSRATYSSVLFRLRKVSAAPPPPLPVAPAPAAASCPVKFPTEVPVEKLRSVAVQRVPGAKSLTLNPHLTDSRVAAFSANAAALARSGYEVDAYLHGTHEQNVDAILRDGLHLSYARAARAFWLTQDFCVRAPARVSVVLCLSGLPRACVGHLPPDVLLLVVHHMSYPRHVWARVGAGSGSSSS